MNQESITRRTGAEILVDSLAAQGVERVFCVPGESYLAVLDALHGHDIESVVCRQEGGAAMMAEADGKMTGRPGICFVTRGPGATNASAGVHIGYQDSTPMILFIGQIAREMRDREAFQEIDYRRMFGEMAKWVAEIDSADRVAEYVQRAFHTAMNGRPGPVVLALPEDMLVDPAPAVTLPAIARTETAPTEDQMSRLADLLAGARRPMLLTGRAGWTAQATADAVAFAEAYELPMAATFRAQDTLPNDHVQYVGDVGIGINPALKARVEAADLLIVAGARLGEITTGGYDLVRPPIPAQKLVHIHSGAEELGRVYAPELAINTSPGAFFKAARELYPPVYFPWGGSLAEARAEYEAWQEPKPIPGDVQMGEVMAVLREELLPDAIICNGAGNYATWVHRFHRFRQWGTQLAPTSGSMGYGVPAAVSAKLRHPDRAVVAFAGDGCFLMTGQELATAVRHDAPVVFIVVDNAMYGTIRMHQEREYPGRESATSLKNPDFAALARAYGAEAWTVTKTDAFRPALHRALACGKPSLIHIHIDPEAITPSQSMSQIRAAAEDRLKG
ncbi:MAG: thiamine pyrophosphate-binding protein [Alphaproteobacteria bacterium]|nr:thiamine pyrophosphate-binding protein [Alphaproteobacteria bacterium]